MALGLATASPGATPPCDSAPKIQPSVTRPSLSGLLIYQAGDSLYLTDFSAATPQTKPITFATRAAPSIPVHLTAPWNANFSRDGRWIVFTAVSTPPGKPPRRDVYISTPTGRHLVNLTGDLNGATPYEDARFSSDGSQVLFKTLYFPASRPPAGAIMAMTLLIPATGDPSRLGPPVTLLDDGNTEFSQPSLSPSGKYLYYSAGTRANEGVYQKNLLTGAVAAVSATPGVESHQPLARDLTTTLFSGWTSAANPNDQVFLYAPPIKLTPTLLKFNDPNYNNSDPAVVDEDYVIFSSNRCVVGGQRSMKLYIGSLSNARYWLLDVGDVNAPTADILGADYTLARP